MHSVKAASKITGLSPDTLRAWERRYAAVTPDRDSSGRRIYNEAEIGRLRLLRRAVEGGHSIQRAARLSDVELKRLIEEDHAGNPSGAGLVPRILSAVEEYRPDLCDEAIGIAIAMLPPLDAVRHVLAPSLVEAGERWHRGQWSAAQEHLLTVAVERLVMVTLHAYRRPVQGAGMVFGTLSGERHSVGALLACFLAASLGLRCCYLGAELPPEELVVAAERSGSSVIALGAVEIPEEDPVMVQLERLCDGLLDGMQVWIGGPARLWDGPALLPERCLPVPTYEAFMERAELLRDSHRL